MLCSHYISSKNKSLFQMPIPFSRPRRNHHSNLLERFWSLLTRNFMERIESYVPNSDENKENIPPEHWFISFFKMTLFKWICINYTISVDFFIWNMFWTVPYLFLLCWMHLFNQYFRSCRAVIGIFAASSHSTPGCHRKISNHPIWKVPRGLLFCSLWINQNSTETTLRLPNF